jgi:hypothetical protein
MSRDGTISKVVFFQSFRQRRFQDDGGGHIMRISSKGYELVGLHLVVTLRNVAWLWAGMKLLDSVLRY